MGWEYYNKIIKDFKNKNLLVSWITIDPYSWFKMNKVHSFEYASNDTLFDPGILNSKIQCLNILEIKLVMFGMFNTYCEIKLNSIPNYF